MKRTMLVTVALAAALAAGCNRNDSNATTANPSGDSSAVGTSGKGVPAGDKDFVRDVTAMNAAELDVARIATDRAADPNTKKFAQMVIDDHTAAGDKLKAIAAQNNIDSTPTDDKAGDTRDKLAKKNGLDFDKEYANAMVDDHQKLVDKLESRIDRKTLSEWKRYQTNPATGDREKTKTEATAVVPEKSDNAVTMSVNQWAADTYPVAYAHLQAAKQLADGLKKRSTD
jgi:predicted outer membrane protein